MVDYTVKLTFETDVNARNDTVAQQAARKKASSIENDAANSHLSLASVDVEPKED